MYEHFEINIKGDSEQILNYFTAHITDISLNFYRNNDRTLDSNHPPPPRPSLSPNSPGIESYADLQLIFQFLFFTNLHP